MKVLQINIQLLVKTVIACILLFSGLVYGQAPNTWIQKSDVGWNAPGGPAARYGAAYFSIGAKGYIGTGEQLGGATNDFWEWDQATNVWTQKASLYANGPRSLAVGFSIGAKGYIGTGMEFFNDTIYYSDFWEWDQVSNNWTQKSDFAGGRRAFAVGFSIGAKGYICSGRDSLNTYQDLWEWDQASDTWTQKADLTGGARYYATGFAIGGKGYVGLGDDAGNNCLNDFWEYDTLSDSWAPKADFAGGPRYGAVGFNVGTSGYICAGGCVAYYNDLWKYNQAADSWVKKADFAGAPRLFAAGFSIGAKAYVGAGAVSAFDSAIVYYGTPINDFWEYDTLSDSWTQKKNFGTLTRQNAAGFSIGNKGYIGTGYLGDGLDVNDFWEWDQTTNVWTQKASFSGGPRDGTISFSIGTKGYIGLGYSNESSPSDFWEWDQATNTWTQKTSFPGTSRMDAVSFSIGAKGYVATGRNGLTILRDFWEWNQATDTWIQKADFTGGNRISASGFSIGTKGYIGLGENDLEENGGFTQNDFWEWDQASNVWTYKGPFPGQARLYAAGFSIGTKGYLGMGATGEAAGGEQVTDFWQWDQLTGLWTREADFNGGFGEEFGPVSFSIGNKGYAGAGESNDFWEYTPDGLKTVSKANGNWSDTATWINNVVPTVADTAVISTGTTVTVNVPSSVNILIVDSAGNLAVNDTSILTIAEDLSNSGTVTGPGTIQFYAVDTFPAGTGSGGTFSNTIPLNLIADANLTSTAPVTINNLTLIGGDTLTINASLRIVGNATLNGSIYGSDTATFNGDTAQLILGNGCMITNLLVNNPQGVTLDPTNLEIGNSLTFIKGNITTWPVNNIYTNYGSVITADAATGWINGVLQLNGIPTSGNTALTFQVGDNTFCDPLEMDLHNLQGSSGAISVFTHRNAAALSELVSSPMDTSKSIARTWSIINSGASFENYDLTLNYNTAEIPAAANQNNFAVAQTEDGGADWTLHQAGPFGIGTQVINLIYNSDFVVGEVDCGKTLPVLTSSINNVTVAGGNDGRIRLTTTGGFGPFTFHLYNGDSITSTGDTTFNITDLDTGVYISAVTTIGGCRAQRSDTVRQSTTGITAFTKDADIQVWPNPASHQLNVKLPYSNSVVVIQLSDITGRIVINQTHTATEIKNNLIVLNLTGIERGIYLLTVESSQSIGKVKVMVE